MTPRRRGKGSDAPPAPRMFSRASLRNLVRLFAYLRPHLGLVIVLCVLTILGVGLGLVGPWLTKVLIDDALLPRDGGALRTVVLAMFAAGLLRLLAGYAGGYLGQMVGHRVIRRMRNQLCEHLQTLTLRFYERQQTGQIMSRITSDTEAVQGTIVGSAQTVVRSVLTLTGAITMMFALNPKLAACAFIPVPIFIASIFFYATQLKSRYKVFREKIAEMNAFLQERIVGVRVVKSFAREQAEQTALEEKTGANYHAYMRAAVIHSSIMPWMWFLGGLCALTIIFVGGGMVIDETMGLGTLMAFLSLLQHFLGPIGEIGGLIGHAIPAGLAAGERVFEFLDEDDRLALPEAPLRPERLDGAVTFENVTFSYGDDDVLNQIDLTVAPAETVALVGPSGTGKTTLVELVSRFYDVERGAVKVDGHNVKDYDPRALRGHIGVVLQEPFLFDVSIRENIAYGDPGADEEAIVAAAAKAEAHEFIAGLPDAYDTIVGERGVTLSVGQKQRISIARALIKNPEILVLDEATSAVDTRTEKAIQSALEAAARDRTTILIAHRLSTTFFADRILVMDEGRIVEQGRPDDLLAKDGIFAQLYNMQALEARIGS